MKRVLVTGSNGLLGQKLSDLYRGIEGIELLATGTGPNRHPAGEAIPYMEMDIRDRDSVLRVFRDFQPHCVIHTAAMTNVDQCEMEKENCQDLNISAVAYICEAANEVGAHLVHLSTDFIFDGTKGPYKEDDLPAPLSFYGNSKWEGERIVQSRATSWAIVRTILVYGVVKDMSRSNIVLWAKQALESGKDMNVVTDQFRSPTLAEDLAMGCRLIEEKQAQGIFHISGSEFMSVFELVQRVAAFWKLPTGKLHPSDSTNLNQPAKRPPVTGFILDKAKKELGYRPHTFEEGLALVDRQLQ